MVTGEEKKKKTVLYQTRGRQVVLRVFGVPILFVSHFIFFPMK